MRSLIKSIALAALTALPTTAMTAEPEKTSADKTYKVVFEVSIEGADKWQGALRNIENTRKELGAGTKIEVVTHGKGVGMLLAKTSAENAELKAKLEQLHTGGVVLAACENTMRRESSKRRISSISPRPSRPASAKSYANRRTATPTSRAADSALLIGL